MSGGVLDSDFPLRQTLRKIWGVTWVLALLALVPLILLFVFGFSVKTTGEYACVMGFVENDRQIADVLGQPATPGLFAWLSYFESGGGLRQGRFSVRLSGPEGQGVLKAQFYRTPIGSSLGVWLDMGTREVEVYNGAYPCP